jgi:hypothetical protein
MDESFEPTAETPEPTKSAKAGRGRVRLKRAALMGIPACVAGGVLMALTAQGVLGAQFEISGLAFTVTADHLHGEGFEQFGQLDNMIPNSPNAGNTGGQEFVATSAIRDATLTNLCQSVNLGGINLKITAGNNGTPVTAHDLTTDSDVLAGDASFTNIQVGGDASTYTQADVAGPAGDFGQQADTVDIDHLRQDNYATTAAIFKLPNLHLSFDSNGC